MLRITRAADAGGTLLRLEGKLLAPWVPELLAQCSDVDGRTGQLSLDLSQVGFADSEGLAALRQLVNQGVLVRCSNGFISELLHVEVP
jgi:ABC-type transporter Mla MlaB component